MLNRVKVPECTPYPAKNTYLAPKIVTFQPGIASQQQELSKVVPYILTTKFYLIS